MTRPDPRRHHSTIVAPAAHEFQVKKSRFLSEAHPLGGVATADEIIAATRRRHPQATHHCTGMVTGPFGEHARSSDDGEPAGTAGMPILEEIRRRALTDILVIVTRYYGGTPLGVGGLGRAYTQAAAGALEVARVVTREVLVPARFDVAHATAGRFEHFLRGWASGHRAVLSETRYGAVAQFELWVRPEDAAALDTDVAAETSGDVTARYGASQVVDFPEGAA